MTSPQLKFTIENNIIKGEKKIVLADSQSVGDILLKVFNDKPNHVVQIDVATGAQTTFNEMRRNSVSCALWLRKQGITHDDVIGICTPLQPRDYIPVIGTLLASAIYNPWHHEVTLETARHLINLTQPKFMFSCASAVDILKDAARLEKIDMKIVCFEEYPDTPNLTEILEQASNDEIEAFKPDNSGSAEDIAMVIFSSGTTGLPKGVSQSRQLIKNLMTATAQFTTHFNKQLWYSPLFWMSGTRSLFQTVAFSKTRILHAAFDPEDTSRVIEEFKVDWLFLSSRMMTYFCKSTVLEKYNFESLKFLFAGGTKLGKQFIEQIHHFLPNVFFAQGYGMTEAGGIISIQRNMKLMKIESVGFVMPNVQVKIVNLLNGMTLGPNQRGEVCFKTPMSMVGYYRNPEATQKMIDNEGWYHTGDEGYYMENGELMLIGRMTEVINYRSFQIVPSEIEEHLMSHKDVVEAAVVPLPHYLDHEIPLAFVKRMFGAKVTEEELVEYSAKLGDMKKLRGGVQFLDELPLVATGKINRKALKELAKTYRSS